MTSTELDWNQLLRDQLEGHWRDLLRPRLEGLTDDEYFWEPVAGAWGVHPRGAGTTPEHGSGAFTIDFDFPAPEPPPVTTIGWRIGHLVVGVLAMRNASHFGREPADYESWDYPGSADAALAQLDQEVVRWLDGVALLGEEGLARPCGPAEGPFAEAPLASLVTHIHREVIHHGAEICLLRDLYLREDH